MALLMEYLKADAKALSLVGKKVVQKAGWTVEYWDLRKADWRVGKMVENWDDEMVDK